MIVFLIVGGIILAPLSFIFHCLFPASFILLATGAASDPTSPIFARLPGVWKRSAVTACITVIPTLSYLWIDIFFDEAVLTSLVVVSLLACSWAIYRLGRENRAALLRMAAAIGFFHSFFIYTIYINMLDVMGVVVWASLLPLAVISLLLGLPSRQSGNGKEPHPKSCPSGAAKMGKWFEEFCFKEVVLIFAAIDIIRRWIKVCRR